MSNHFYVYEHWRPDTGRCFYVGKGKDGRAFRTKKNRNKFYLRIAKKLETLGLDVEIKIIASNLSEHHAHAFEVQRIAYWRGHGAPLANLTDGGEGVSGLKHSKETKLKLSEKSKRVMKHVMADPEIRAKISKAVTERMANPQNRLNLSKKMIEVMADANLRQRLSAGMVGVMSDVEVRASRSRSMSVIMADAQCREALSRKVIEFLESARGAEAAQLGDEGKLEKPGNSETSQRWNQKRYRCRSRGGRPPFRSHAIADGRSCLSRNDVSRQQSATSSGARSQAPMKEFVGKFVVHWGADYHQSGEIISQPTPEIILVRFDRSDGVPQGAMMLLPLASLIAELDENNCPDPKWEFFNSKKELRAFCEWLD